MGLPGHAVPAEVRSDAFDVRSYWGNEGVGRWLEIRNRAFTSMEAAGRAWDEADFRREFLEQPWWRPEWMWLAFPSNQDAPRSPVGTVTLAVRQTPGGLRPAVHWLCVLPEWRRRGVARLLMSTLERAACEAGHRQIWLETHTDWKEAAAFYERFGYEIVTRNGQS